MRNRTEDLSFTCIIQDMVKCTNILHEVYIAYCFTFVLMKTKLSSYTATWKMISAIHEFTHRKMDNLDVRKYQHLPVKNSINQQINTHTVAFFIKYLPNILTMKILSFVCKTSPFFRRSTSTGPRFSRVQFLSMSSTLQSYQKTSRKDWQINTGQCNSHTNTCTH